MNIHRAFFLFHANSEDTGKYNPKSVDVVFSSVLAPTLHDDHAIHDEIDVHDLVDILGRQPANQDIDEIIDNKTDDDQPDLETDESSGEKKMKGDVSMEGFTEATDITTPVEMRKEQPSRRDDTSAQISDFSDFQRGTSDSHRPKSATLFDITDPEDGSDIEEVGAIADLKHSKLFRDPSLQDSSASDKTLMAENSTYVDSAFVASDRAEEVELRIKKREGKIERKFDRLSLELSEAECDQADTFVKVSQEITAKEEEEAANSFDRLVEDNFMEDKSEDWLSNDSSPDEQLGDIHTKTTLKEDTLLKKGE